MTCTPYAQSVSQFGMTIFAEISQLAARRSVVDLSMGFPDFAGPEWLKAAAVRVFAGDQHQYALSAGILPLRQAIAEKLGWWLGLEVEAESELTITTGASEATFATLLSLVDPGDEVIILEPSFDSYVPDVLMAGATPRCVHLHPPDWSLDANELRAAFGPRTRALLLNTPHNPTGKVFDRAELELIAGLCRQWNALALCDEVSSTAGNISACSPCPVCARAPSWSIARQKPTA